MTNENSTQAIATNNVIVGNSLIVYGNVKAISQAGITRTIQPNSPIFANDTIITDSDGMITVVFIDGTNTQLNLGRMSEVVIDEDVFVGTAPEDITESAVDVENMQVALAEGDFDPTMEFPAPAAGGGGFISAASSPLIRFDLTGEEVTPDAGAGTTGVGYDFLYSDATSLEETAQDEVTPVLQPLFSFDDTAPPSGPASEEPPAEDLPSDPPPPDRLVRPEGPELEDGIIHRVVEEEALDNTQSLGNPDENDIPEDSIQPDAHLITGSLSSLVATPTDGSAPGQVTFSFVTNPTAPVSLLSQGDVVYYETSGNILTAYAESDSEPRVVFELTVDANGDYQYNQIDQLDHPPGDGENYLDLDFSSFINVTNTQGGTTNLGSGGSATGTAAFVISVVDDVPEVVETAQYFFVSEYAGFDNVIGTYELNADGNPTNPHIIVESTDAHVHDTFSGSAVMGQEQSGSTSETEDYYTEGVKVGDGSYEAGTKMFLIANGARNNDFSQDSDLRFIDTNAGTDEDPNWVLQEQSDGEYSDVGGHQGIWYMDSQFDTAPFDSGNNGPDGYSAPGDSTPSHFADQWTVSPWPKEFLNDVPEYGGEVRIEDLNLGDGDFDDTVLRVEKGAVVSESGLADGSGTDLNLTTVVSGNFFETSAAGIQFKTGADEQLTLNVSSNGIYTPDNFVDVNDPNGSGTIAINQLGAADAGSFTGTPVTINSDTGNLQIWENGDWQYELTDNTVVNPDNDQGGRNRSDGDYDRFTADQVQDVFEITATDFDGDSVDTNFIININDDGPSAVDAVGTALGYSSYQTDTPPVGAVFDVLEYGADNNPDETSFSARVTSDNGSSGNRVGRVKVNEEGKLEFTPGVDFSGQATITYTLTDSDGDTSRGTLLVNETSTSVFGFSSYKDASANNDGDTGTSDMPPTVEFDVSASAPTIASGGGTVAISTDGNIEFTPGVNFAGESIINYTDGNGNPAQLVVTERFLKVGQNSDDTGDSGDDYAVGNGLGAIEGGDAGDILIGDYGGSDTVGNDLNLLMIMDSSGSMGGKNGRMGDMKNAVNELMNGLNEDDFSNVRVHLVEYNTLDGTATVGEGNESVGRYHAGTYDLVRNGEDIVFNSVGNLNDPGEAIDDMRSGGFTNYEAGMQQGLEWLSIRTGDGGPLMGSDGAKASNVTLFMTDGAPNRYVDENGDELSAGGSRTAMEHILNDDPTNSNTNDDDSFSEVQILQNWGTLRAIGIDIDNQNSINRLNQIDDTGHALTSTSGALPDALYNSATTILSPVGDDTIDGGGGNDLIFGDALNTDALAEAHGLDTVPGAGWEVFEKLESSDSWTRTDTINYIENNQEELSNKSAGFDNDRVGGNDTIDGGSGQDIIYGMEGEDTVEGSTGADSIDGGSGSDTLLSGGAGDDEITGGSGSDTIAGGRGNDTLSGGGGNDRIHGNEGNDIISGESGNDKLFGDDGHDQLGGDAGADRIRGGTGNDTLEGGTGNDKLYGDDGRDTLFGEEGKDQLIGGDGRDTLDGGTGNDILVGDDVEKNERGHHAEDPANNGKDWQGHIVDDEDRDTLQGGEGDDIFGDKPAGGGSQEDRFSDVDQADPVVEDDIDTLVPPLSDIY